MKTLHCAALLGAAALFSGTVAAGTESAEDGAKRIAAAFESHGMEAEQAACYGKTISGELGSDSARAAEIVETAENAEEIEAGVKDGGLEMVEAFLAAKTACGG